MKNSLELLPRRQDTDSLYYRFLPLVIHIARQVWMARQFLPDLDELVADGLYGLVRGDRRFDWISGDENRYKKWIARYIKGDILQGLFKWDRAKGRGNRWRPPPTDAGLKNVAAPQTHNTEEHDWFEWIVSGLDAQKARILKLYYVDGLMDKEVAVVTQRTPQHMWAIRTEALSEIRPKLAACQEGD